MSDTLLAAIVGAIAGIITGTIASLAAPWANWRVERKKEQLTYRRNLVERMYTMLAAVRTDLKDTMRQLGNIDYADLGYEQYTFLALLEKYPEYQILKNYMNQEDAGIISKAGHQVWHRDVEYALSRLEIIIGGLETKWKLV